MALNGLCAVVP